MKHRFSKPEKKLRELANMLWEAYRDDNGGELINLMFLRMAYRLGQQRQREISKRKN